MSMKRKLDANRGKFSLGLANRGEEKSLKVEDI